MKQMPYAPTLAITDLFELANLAFYGRLAFPVKGCAWTAGEVHNS